VSGADRRACSSGPDNWHILVHGRSLTRLLWGVMCIVICRCLRLVVHQLVRLYRCGVLRRRIFNWLRVLSKSLLGVLWRLVRRRRLELPLVS
jgi:hypothetical protein